MLSASLLLSVFTYVAAHMGHVQNMDQSYLKTHLSSGNGITYDFKTPRDFAKAVGDQMLNHTDLFFFWGYGGAIIFDALHKANRTFDFDYAPTLNKFLNMYKEQSSYTGYKILNKIPIPFDQALGDHVGLFPVAYVNRLHYENDKEEAKTDGIIVEEVINHFLLGWPRHLPDGTVSRGDSWEPGTNESFVWADDAFMGLTLPARFSYWRPNVTLANWILDQALLFNEHLEDSSDHAYFHGYNDFNKHQSCCKWGRGNGWTMMSHVEVLESVAKIEHLRESQKFQKLVSYLASHSEALAKYQSEDGRWRQLVDQPSTYLETSGTAMILTTIIKGVRHGFLDRDQFRPVVEKGWKGLMNAVDSDGVINGVCVGTGVMTSIEAYNNRPTSYLQGANGGLGAVLYAAVEMELWMRSENKQL